MERSQEQWKGLRSNGKASGTELLECYLKPTFGTTAQIYWFLASDLSSVVWGLQQC